MKSKIHKDRFEYQFCHLPTVPHWQIIFQMGILLFVQLILWNILRNK